jgi:hypothetical protein
VHLLDSIIAFAAIMLVASLIVTAGTQLTISLLGLRGANLRRSLADLFETACDDGDARRYRKIIAHRVLRHPLVSGSVFSRFGIGIEELSFVSADAAVKLRWAGNGIPFQPWLLGALSGFFIWPGTLATIKRISSLDICTFSSIVATYVPFLDFCEHPWRTGAIVGAVFGGLVSRWRLATTVRADELVAVLEKLSTPPGGSLPDPAQRAMLVIAGEAQGGPRSQTNSPAAEFDKFVRELPENNDDGITVGEEKTAEPPSDQSEPRLGGLNSWFDHAMDRASQRFALQARLITVVLSLILVFATHLDAIRLFRMLSSDVQARAHLTDSADAVTKQAGLLTRTREDGAREVVPGIYRKAMVDVLQSIPIVVEQAKSKPHHSSRHTTAADVSQAAAGGSQTETPDGLPTRPQESTGSQVLAASAKESRHRSSRPSNTKVPATEAEKSVATPGEDRAMMEAKARASKVLESTPGFASREAAVSWLRSILASDPAVENLISNYEQAVNAQLVSDGDKLLDHSASLKHDLARSELQLVPENWPGWKPTGNELPGFLVTLAILCLGAPVCYNLLKTVATLRPLSPTGRSIIHPDRRIRQEDRRSPQTRKRVRPQTAAHEEVRVQPDDEQDSAVLIERSKE